MERAWTAARLRRQDVAATGTAARNRRGRRRLGSHGATMIFAASPLDVDSFVEPAAGKEEVIEHAEFVARLRRLEAKVWRKKWDLAKQARHEKIDLDWILRVSRAPPTKFV